MATQKKESYRDNPLLKRVGINVSFTEEQVEEYIKCRKDPLYFSKYIKIITLDEGVTEFKMYDFQKDCVEDFKDHRFNIVLKSRQQGLSTLAAAYSVWLAIFKKEQNGNGKSCNIRNGENNQRIHWGS